MKGSLFNSKDNIFKGILIVQIMLMIDAFFKVFDIETSQMLSLIRYIFYFFGWFWLLKGVFKNHVKVPFLYVLFLIWVTYLLLSALPELMNPFRNYIRLKMFISGLLVIYTLPYLICADLSVSLFRSLFKLSSYMLVVYIVLSIPIYISDVSFLSKGLSEYITFLVEGSIIMLMLFSFQSKKANVRNVISVVIAVVIMMLLSRRNKVVFYGGGLGLAIILNVLNGYVSAKRKVVIIFATFIGFVFLLFSGDVFDAFFNKMETGMSSREVVIEDFIYDFNKTPRDWIFGRGLFGEFDGGLLNDKETGLRNGIENGYLQLILKGGWVYLGLLILISIRSIYLGLFKSNNIFVKGCACIILLYYLDMVGFGVMEYASLKFIYIFLSISVCSSRKWRMYSNEYLKQQLFV